MNKDKFITIVNETRKYCEIIEKLEETLNVRLERLYNYPRMMLDLLEKESNRIWTNEIYDLIYSSSKRDFDIETLYNKVIELPTKSSINVRDLFRTKLQYELMSNNCTFEESFNLVDKLSEEVIDKHISKRTSIKDLAWALLQ